jgi:hypothetical protein
MPAAAFEPTIPASERPQIHALDCAAAGIDSIIHLSTYIYQNIFRASVPEITGLVYNIF